MMPDDTLDHIKRLREGAEAGAVALAAEAGIVEGDRGERAVTVERLREPDTAAWEDSVPREVDPRECLVLGELLAADAEWATAEAAEAEGGDRPLEGQQREECLE